MELKIHVNFGLGSISKQGLILIIHLGYLLLEENPSVMAFAFIEFMVKTNSITVLFQSPVFNLVHFALSLITCI